MKKYSIVFVLFLLMVSPAQAEMKIWNMETEVRKDFGRVHLNMQKMFNRDAPINGFHVSAFHRDTSVSGVFRNACNPLVTFKITAGDTRKLDLSRFLQTRSGNDLPIADVINVMQKAISEECDDSIEVMRFTFRPAHHTKEDYSYEGTLTKTNGWRIQDGRVATSFDDAHTFELAFRDMFSVAGMRYRGACEDEPVLLLEPQFANDQERALAKPAKIHSYGSVAQTAAKMYAKECPNTKVIKHIVNPIPETHQCKVEEEDCFMITRKDNDWKVDMSQFDYKEYPNSISDFNDMLEVLAAGRFDIVKHFRGFFAFYVEASLGAYSDKCGAYIKDPVGRQIFTIDREYDGNGFLMNETIDGPPRKIRIEGKYVKTFDRYFDSWKGWAVGYMINSVANSHHRETNPFMATSLAMGFFTSNINMIEETLHNNCTDDRIVTAFDNMYNYANGLPAITGKFTTDKEPPDNTKNGSSAPIAEKIIQAKRQGRVQAQNQRAQDVARKRMEDFQKRKAKGIAVHGGSKARQHTHTQNNTHAQGNTQPQQKAPAHRYAPTPAQDQAELLRQHQEQQKKMQELGIAYQKEMQAATLQFGQDMQNATTTEQRHAIQQKFQKDQQQRLLDMQQAVMEMKKR